ncbi:MAG: hypothetical protein AAGA53_10050 [Pseudomonadota bacterium]
MNMLDRKMSQKKGSLVKTDTHSAPTPISYDFVGRIKDEWKRELQPKISVGFTARALDAPNRMAGKARVSVYASQFAELQTKSGVADLPLVRAFEGVDVIVEWQGDLNRLVQKMQAAAQIGPFKLTMIFNHGALVWPDCPKHPETTNHWRCRFVNESGTAEAEVEVPELLAVIGEKMRWLHVEKLGAYKNFQVRSVNACEGATTLKEIRNDH